MIRWLRRLLLGTVFALPFALVSFAFVQTPVQAQSGDGEIDCTYDNKIRMMNDYADFATFIGNSIVKLVEQEPTEEDLEKNS